MLINSFYYVRCLEANVIGLYILLSCCLLVAKPRAISNKKRAHLDSLKLKLVECSMTNIFADWKLKSTPRLHQAYVYRDGQLAFSITSSTNDTTSSEWLETSTSSSFHKPKIVLSVSIKKVTLRGYSSRGGSRCKRPS